MAVRLYWKPTIGHLRLARLTAADVQRTINDLRDRGLAPDSVRLAHATLRAALETALRMDLGLVHRNVAKLVEPIPIANEEVIPFSEEEMGQILAVAGADRLGAYVKVAVALGLRPQEGRALRWPDLDLDGVFPSLGVHQAFSRAPGGERLGPPKTPRSRRQIPLPVELVDVLRQHRRLQLEERMKAGPAWQDGGFVFTMPDGRPLTDSTLRRWFASVSKRAGVDGHRLYDLRHTAASLLLAQGVHPRVVMAIFGHSTYRLTMDTYTHVMPAAEREAAEAMGRALTRIAEGGSRAVGGQFGGQGRSGASS
jgi:integrase